MAGRNQRVLKLGGVAVLVVAALSVSGRATALDLRVQARSNLNLEARTAGTNLIVSGQLRDDLGQPLPGRELRVRAVRKSVDGEKRVVRVDTDESGRYATRFEVAPGEYLVEVIFEATPHLTSARAEGSVRVERKPVELTVKGPLLVRDGSRAVPVRIRASIEGQGLPLPVTVRSTSGETRQVELDDRGRGRFDASGMLRPGSNQITVRSSEGKYRSAATARKQIRMVRELSVEARTEAVFERLQRGAAVEGRVLADGTPIGEAPVEVELVRDAPTGAGPARSESRGAGRVVQEGTTDAEGRFHVFVPREKLVDGTWQATVRVLPDVGKAWRRSAGEVAIDRTLSRLVVDGAAVLAVLAVLFVAGREVWRVVAQKLEELRRKRERSERRRRAFREEAELEPVSVPADTVGEPDAESVTDRVRGEIWDPWRDEPVPGAALELSDAEDDTVIAATESDGRGRFSFEELETGSRELVVEADFYIRGRFEFEIPHDGALDPCRLEIVPVPLKIRRLYQSLIELAAGEDLWGELSPRQIRETLRGVLGEVSDEADAGESGEFSARISRIAAGDVDQLETSRDYLQALTELVEETYFSPRSYGKETWRVAREVAVELREQLANHADER